MVILWLGWVVIWCISGCFVLLSGVGWTVGLVVCFDLAVHTRMVCLLLSWLRLLVAAFASLFESLVCARFG